MRMRGLKMTVKRLGALTGAFVLAISVTSYSTPQRWSSGMYFALQGTVLPQGDRRAFVPYSQRVHEQYDPAVLEQAMAEFETACQTEGQEEAVSRLYDTLISEYDCLSTRVYMAQIAYDRDISEPAAAKEQAYTADLYMEMSEKVVMSIQKGLASSYHPLLSQKMGEERVTMVESYKPYTEAELELLKEEDQLIRKYEQLAASETSVNIDGELWTYDRLEDDDFLTSQAYGEIQEALSKERNRILGACLLELADVRRKQAAFYGFDSYSDYMYQLRYGRDYTLQDVSQLCEIVKREIVPLYNALCYADMDYSSYEELDKLENRSTKELLETTGTAVGSLSGELGDIFRYMRENELYDIQSDEPGKDRVEVDYTVRLPADGDGYIFLNRENTFRDYQALIHEFGHFSAYYYDKTPELYSGFVVDVMEIQSMGLELLATNYAGELAGEGGPAYACETVNDMFYNIISACMFNELEELLYENPNVELEDLNRRFKEIQDSYEGWYYQAYDDVCYDWVEVPHIFYDPMYYIGYGTASLTVLDLWALSQKNMEGAVDTYMGILKGGMEVPYRETAQRWGLRDIFDEEQVAELANEIRDYYGLETPKKVENEKPYEDERAGADETDLKEQNHVLITLGIMLLGGIGAVIVLQLALVGMGGFIIWLLMKNKNSRN